MDLEQYNNDPTDPRISLNASNKLADVGQHDSALLLAEAALSMTPDDETKLGILERFSISGFYSKLPRRRYSGKVACEEIATDKSNPWHTRNLARQNSTYYASSVSDLMPSTVLQEVDFVPLYNYRPMNPSVASHDGKLWMIQRTVNYIIRPDGSYDMRGDSAIRTINYFIELNNDLSIKSHKEILPPDYLPSPLYNMVIGWEDCRLFFWKDEPWCTATVRELNQEGYCEIVISKLVNTADNKMQFSDYRVIRPNFIERQHEKNWMPMVVGQDLFFMYSADPTRIIDSNGELVSSRVSHIASDSFRGGGSLIPFDNGWLALIHESHGMPDWRRRYMHRWVWYDSYGRLSRYSQSFYIKELGIEFAAGLTWHPVEDKVIASFGMHDKSSWLATFDPREIKKWLHPAGEPLRLLPTDVDTMVWLASQTNSTLKNSKIVDKCTSIITAATLPLHVDGPKNWDNIIAIWHTILTTELTSPVMDVAATPESAYLPGLKRLGYKNLISINLTQQSEEIINGIKYQYGDCTNTSFPDKYFGFISCLSVIEHGVDLKKFLAESYRLLMDGGYLFISTDYWVDPVDTFGQTAFGSPVKVFSSSDMTNLLSIAQEIGFEPTGNLDLSCQDRVVNWIGMDYTFINVLLRKK